MEKRQYIFPQTEVMQYGSEIVMQAFHEASLPSDPFAAPERKKAF